MACIADDFYLNTLLTHLVYVGIGQRKFAKNQPYRAR
ncbi:hypothetical protein LEADMM068B1_22525 [Leclercia adecarboxylata]